MELTATTTQEGKHSLVIHKPTVTGKFCFQFDGEEPTEICEIFDNAAVKLELPSPAKKEGEEIKDSEMSFEKGGRKFRLFIKANG